ncbi:MAG: type II toxin-antitoxin system RelE/ParE family toxin [Clostridiales Family XIII bacterium]|jgi:plasmid stabilization system protein ParE|nr:type II toxin-antitoxin system RelE/ParE family toxin [Clostridiales Family XIII bacterium]
MTYRKYKVVISDDALGMLDAHIEFVSRVSKSAARRLVDAILNDMESLSEMPERCPHYENSFVPPDVYRKLLSNKRYLIIFEITSEAVFVDYIVDTRSDV